MKRWRRCWVLESGQSRGTIRRCSCNRHTRGGGAVRLEHGNAVMNLKMHVLVPLKLLHKLQVKVRVWVCPLLRYMRSRLICPHLFLSCTCHEQRTPRATSHVPQVLLHLAAGVAVLKMKWENDCEHDRVRVGRAQLLGVHAPEIITDDEQDVRRLGSAAHGRQAYCNPQPHLPHCSVVRLMSRAEMIDSGIRFIV